MEGTQAPADWYPDPSNPGSLRYWDGQEWTEHTHTPEAPVVKPDELSGMGTPAAILLAIFAVVELGIAASNLVDLNDLNTEQGLVDFAESGSPASGVTSFFSLFGLASGLLFLIWSHRAYRNIQRVGGQTHFTTKWAVWAWLIPGLNLFRPKQVLDEIWRASQAGMRLEDENWRNGGLPARLTALWTSWVTSTVVGITSVVLLFADASLTVTNSGQILVSADAVERSLAGGAIAALLAIPGLLLAADFVRTISARQDEALGL